MRTPPMLLAAALVACPAKDDVSVDDTDTDADVDLTVALDGTQTRAGVITDPSVLPEGVFAEGQPGDVMLRNDRVRFVVQGVRTGSYIVEPGGGVIDAALWHDDGTPGRDLIKDWSTMVGFGRVLAADAVEVLDDGTTGGAAVVRVTGHGEAIGFIEGNLESFGLVRDLGLEITQTYTLAPGSWLLEVETEVRAPEAQELDLADLMMGSPEAGWTFIDGAGFLSDAATYRWAGYVDRDTGGTVAILAATPEPLRKGAAGIIADLADLVVAGRETGEAGPDTVLTYRRFYGVGPDLDAIAAESMDRAGVATTPVEAEVTAPDGLVEGALVIGLEDGRPATFARTDASGRATLHLEAGEPTSLAALGQGDGLFTDLPSGAVPYPAYGHPDVQDRVLATLADGSEGPSLARGRGVATGEPLTLGEPGRIEVVVSDGGPFAVRLTPTEAPPVVDPRLAPDRPGGVGTGWARDGDVTLTVAPGTYTVLVHRGVRHELHTEQVTVAAGDTARVEASLAESVAASGWLLADPHSHSVPSGDAEITMEDRVIVMAGQGVQVHFGTDHDRPGDYRPLLGALDLADHLTSVVSVETSPTLRGHVNVYPLLPDPTQPNLGSVAWWNDLPDTTDELAGFLRETYGDVILQANHPTDGGIGDAAGWRPGEVRKADRWISDLDATEVMNSADTEFFEFWLDLALHGQFTTPVGVSDSHSHRSGHVGTSATWMHVGVDDPADLTSDALVSTMRAGEVVPSRGPLLLTTPRPGALVAGDATLEARAITPSWFAVDRLRLLVDGAEVDVREDDHGTFTLDLEDDAVLVLIAEGDTPMQPVDGERPWAMAAWRVDGDGDGTWTAPLPPLVP